MVTLAHGRRGAAMTWSIAGLALALALTPLYVRACESLVRVAARGGHRLRAVNVGTAELDRQRATPARRAYGVPELPGGECRAEITPVAGLWEVRVTVAWREASGPARCEWTTLVGGAP